jgi:hypothetical protein
LRLIRVLVQFLNYFESILDEDEGLTPLPVYDDKETELGLSIQHKIIPSVNSTQASNLPMVARRENSKVILGRPAHPIASLAEVKAFFKLVEGMCDSQLQTLHGRLRLV